MKVYTKTGDKGTTSLFDLRKVKKYDQRVECYGTIDELNAFMGLTKAEVEDENIKALLDLIQRKLFVVGAELATDDTSKLKERVEEADVQKIENEIDLYWDKLGEKFSFVVPGVNKESSYMHVIRTIARRAERQIVKLHEDVDLNPYLCQYVNRISDLFYVLSRILETK